MSCNENLFYFITGEIEFEETIVFEEAKQKGARVLITAMELEKVSKNGRLYKLTEGKRIAKSLIGKEVFYGTDLFGRHDNKYAKKGSKKKSVGFVETATVLGKKIKAVIKITNKRLIAMLKKGVKFLFSVGGQAISETIKKIGGKLVHILNGAKCNHLQIVDKGTPVGFPNAKMEKLIEIQETVMVCEGGLCHLVGRPPKKKRRLVIIEEEIDYGVDYRTGRAGFTIEL